MLRGSQREQQNDLAECLHYSQRSHFSHFHHCDSKLFLCGLILCSKMIDNNTHHTPPLHHKVFAVWVLHKLDIFIFLFLLIRNINVRLIIGMFGAQANNFPFLSKGLNCRVFHWSCDSHLCKTRPHIIIDQIQAIKTRCLVSKHLDRSQLNLNSDKFKKRHILGFVLHSIIRHLIPLKFCNILIYTAVHFINIATYHYHMGT